MKWIALTDERAPEVFEKHGITWQLPAPRELNPDGIQINPRRLRRLIRSGGGMGKLTVANATIESPTYVGGSMNPDGTFSITSAQRKSRTSQGTLKRDDYERGDAFRKINSTLYRPEGQVDIDLEEIRNKLRTKDQDTNPQLWMRSIDNSLKSGIVENSIRANVLDTSLFPELTMLPKFGKPLFLGIAGLKAWIAYKGIEDFTQGLDTTTHLAQLGSSIVTENVFQGIVGVMYLKMLGSDVDVKDFRPSLICPQIPFDRTILAGAQQYLSPPVVRYAE